MLDCRPALDHLVERVLLLRTGIVGRVALVGVVGEPGAGKSTLAASVVEGLRARGCAAVLVPMDGFHLANVALAARGLADRKGAIETFDGAGFAALLGRLRAEGPHTVWAPTYDRSVEESVAGAIGVPPGTEVVVTEGNYLLVDEEPWSEVGRAARRGVGGAHGPRGAHRATAGPARAVRQVPGGGTCLGGGRATSPTPPASARRSTAPTSTSSPGRTTRQRIRFGACRRRGSGRSWPAV